MVELGIGVVIAKSYVKFGVSLTKLLLREVDIALVKVMHGILFVGPYGLDKVVLGKHHIVSV